MWFEESAGHLLGGCIISPISNPIEIGGLDLLAFPFFSCPFLCTNNLPLGRKSLHKLASCSVNCEPSIESTHPCTGTQARYPFGHPPWAVLCLLHTVWWKEDTSTFIFPPNLIMVLFLGGSHVSSLMHCEVRAPYARGVSEGCPA